MHASGTYAQVDLSIDEGAAGLHQMLKRLQTTASVLHVVAHPDDEDGPLMCYCARGLGARAMLFSITRGEGGANLISSYFFDELGALRTLEHVKAAQYYGSELFYSSAADYGYSKNLAEANRTWNHGERILAELVEVIRRHQPMVIMSRFRGDPRDGHGHHQMAGVLARKAFRAAADPAQFPEQLERGLRTWQSYKLYINSRPQWNESDRDNWTIAVPTGKYDAVLGKSYGQIARFGLGFQRSQGISGHIGEAGERTSYYRLQAVADGLELANRETQPTDNLPVRIQDIGRLPGRTPRTVTPSGWKELALELETQLHTAIEAFNVQEPTATIEPLTKALRKTNQMLERLSEAGLSANQQTLARNQLQLKSNQIQRAICLAAGIQLDAWVEPHSEAIRKSIQFATLGQDLFGNARIVVRNAVSAKVTAFTWQTPKGWRVHSTSNHQQPGVNERDSGAAFVQHKPLEQNKPRSQRSLLTVTTDAAATRPYWSRNSIREPFYDVEPNNQQAPLPVFPLTCRATLEIDNTPVTMRAVAETRFRDPLFGNVRYPIQVVPPVSVSFILREGVLPIQQASYDLGVVVRSLQDTDVKGSVRLQTPDGWAVEPSQHPLDGTRSENEESQYRFSICPTKDDAEQPCRLRAVVDWNGKEYDQSVTTVTVRDLDRVNIYRPAEHIVHMVDAKIAGTPRVGYVSGSGDDVAQSLTMLGVIAETLTGEDLASGDLNQFDVILVGVRAYAVRKDLRKHNARLLDFVKHGGTLIVQYQTPEFDENFGPYPYSMGRRPEEISEEDAAVTVLAPHHPLMNEPNQITAADFEGWLEQRGSKFLTSWSDQYIPILECHDTGQEPQRGGLLVARHGKGVYVYSAYAWYRQLPNGVPGAFRLMANHLSLPVTMGGATSPR